MAGSLKINPPIGRMPVLQFCAPTELRVDPAYQRGTLGGESQTLIRRIAQNWNWDLCQPLVVARRQDFLERLFVIDGQHRLEAARLRGDIAQLPCVIVEYDSAAEEAAAFVELNQQRRPLSKLDIFRASVASGEAQAAAIMAAITDAGLTLAPHTNHTAWKPGMVSHIGGIQRAWTREGQDVTQRALIALAQGFRNQVLRYGGTIFRGIVRICKDENREHGAFRGERFERFLLMLQRQSQSDWMAEINRYFGENPEMFRAEAAEGLFRREWQRALGRNIVIGRSDNDIAVRLAKPGAFGLGAADDARSDEWAWCDQCDNRRTRAQVAACRSPFCRLKVVA